MYPTEINEEEQAAGFQLVEVANPRAGFAFQSETVPAVLLELSETDRLVKIQAPDGRTQYRHDRHGYYPDLPETDPKWLPAFDLLPASPVSRAVEIAKRQVSEDAMTPIVAVPVQ